MTTCIYCDTSYATFQSNCSNCGGALPPPANSSTSFFSDQSPAEPPPAPRHAPDKIIWRILFTEAWFIVGFVFFILGVIFSCTGAGLTAGIITAFVGIPFLGFGLLCALASLPVLVIQYNKAKQKLHVFRTGEATLGEIMTVQENLA
ncbi:MAG: hypothetical protein AAF485_06110, partial [Chloroflexota bacterium]